MKNIANLDGYQSSEFTTHFDEVQNYMAWGAMHKRRNAKDGQDLAYVTMLRLYKKSFNRQIRER